MDPALLRGKHYRHSSPVKLRSYHTDPTAILLDAARPPPVFHPPVPMLVSPSKPRRQTRRHSRPRTTERRDASPPKKHALASGFEPALSLPLAGSKEQRSADATLKYIRVMETELESIAEDNQRLCQTLMDATDATARDALCTKETTRRHDIAAKEQAAMSAHLFAFIKGVPRVQQHASSAVGGDRRYGNDGPVDAKVAADLAAKVSALAAVTERMERSADHFNAASRHLDTSVERFDQAATQRMSPARARGDPEPSVLVEQREPQIVYQDKIVYRDKIVVQEKVVYEDKIVTEISDADARLLRRTQTSMHMWLSKWSAAVHAHYLNVAEAAGQDYGAVAEELAAAFERQRRHCALVEAKLAAANAKCDSLAEEIATRQQAVAAAPAPPVLPSIPQKVPTSEGSTQTMRHASGSRSVGTSTTNTEMVNAGVQYRPVVIAGATPSASKEIGSPLLTPPRSPVPTATAAPAAVEQTVSSAMTPPGTPMNTNAEIVRLRDLHSVQLAELQEQLRKANERIAAAQKTAAASSESERQVEALRATCDELKESKLAAESLLAVVRAELKTVRAAHERECDELQRAVDDITADRDRLRAEVSRLAAHGNDANDRVVPARPASPPRSPPRTPPQRTVTAAQAQPEPTASSSDASVTRQQSSPLVQIMPASFAGPSTPVTVPPMPNAKPGAKTPPPPPQHLSPPSSPPPPPAALTSALPLPPQPAPSPQAPLDKHDKARLEDAKADKKRLEAEKKALAEAEKKAKAEAKRREEKERKDREKELKAEKKRAEEQKKAIEASGGKPSAISKFLNRFKGKKEEVSAGANWNSFPASASAPPAEALPSPVTQTAPVPAIAMQELSGFVTSEDEAAVGSMDGSVSSTGAMVGVAADRKGTMTPSAFTAARSGDFPSLEQPPMTPQQAAARKNSLESEPTLDDAELNSSLSLSETGSRSTRNMSQSFPSPQGRSEQVVSPAMTPSPGMMPTLSPAKKGPAPLNMDTIVPLSPRAQPNPVSPTRAQGQPSPAVSPTQKYFDSDTFPKKTRGGLGLALDSIFSGGGKSASSPTGLGTSTTKMQSTKNAKYSSFDD